MSYVNSMKVNTTDYAMSGFNFCYVNNESNSVRNRTVTFPTGFNLDSNLTFKVVFTNGYTSTNTTNYLQINGKSVKVNVHGSLQNLPIHTLNNNGTTSYPCLQKYTALEMYYDGTEYVVVGNPIVLSSDNYTVYANGLKIQWVSDNQATNRNYVDLPIAFSTTTYFAIGVLVNKSGLNDVAYQAQIFPLSKTTQKVTFAGTTGSNRGIFAIGY